MTSKQGFRDDDDVGDEKDKDVNDDDDEDDFSPSDIVSDAWC